MFYFYENKKFGTANYSPERDEKVKFHYPFLFYYQHKYSFINKNEFNFDL